MRAENLGSGSRRVFWTAWSVICLASHSIQSASSVPTASQPLQTPSSRTTTVAVIADEHLAQLPLVSLLEVQLGGDKSLRLVERTEIARVISEQEIQALCDPKQGRLRGQLGALLKADLLIILRSEGQGRERHLDFIVCDTAMGLRLLIRQLPLEQDNETLVETLGELVSKALGKCVSQRRALFAVPPFVSQDLTRAYDHWQGALATLVQEALDKQPGVVLVELAEAQAIAQELRMAGTSTGVQRPLPYYVLGEYRNETRDQPRTRVQLSIRQGETHIKTHELTGVPPDSVPAALAEAMQVLVQDALETDWKRSEPLVEAQQLANRARDFLEVSNWSQAADMIEASLLLNLSQLELERLAMDVYSRLTLQAAQRAGRNYEEKLKRAAKPYRRCLDHLQNFLRSHDFGERSSEDYNLLITCYRCLCETVNNASVHFYNQGNEQEMVKVLAVSQPLLIEYREIVIRAFEDKARQGRLTREFLYVVTTVASFETVGVRETEIENEALRLRVIRALAPTSLYLPSSLLEPTGIFWKNPEIVEAHRRFLQQVAELPNPGYPAIVDRERRRFEEELKTRQADAADLERERKAASRPAPSSAPARKPAPAPREMPASDVEYTPLKLRFENVDSIDSRVRDHPIEGWMSLGNGVEMAWKHSEVYLMKRPGVLRLVLEARGNVLSDRDLCWDGQFVWVVRDGKALCAIDPVSERVTTISEKDGLPPVNQAVVTPVNPGMVFVAAAVGEWTLGSAFTPARGWCGTVALQAESKPEITIIHEARRNTAYEGGKVRSRASESGHVATGDGMIDDAPDVSFVPWLAWRPPQSDSVFVGRRDSLGRQLRPFLVDLQERKVRVLDFSFRGVSKIVWSANQLVWYKSVSPFIPEKGGQLWSMESPSVEPHQLTSGPPLAMGTKPFFLDENVAYTEDEAVRVIEAPGQSPRLVRWPQLKADRMQDILGTQIWRSDVYGLLMLDYRLGMCQIRFASQASKPDKQ